MGMRLASVAGWLWAALPLTASALDNEISVGVGHLDSDEVRIADRAGLRRDGLHALGDFHVVYRLSDSDGAGYWELSGSNLAQDNRALGLRHGVQGRYQVQIEYREVATRLSDVSVSPLIETGGAVLQLPGGWVPATTTVAMPRLEESLQPSPLGVERKSAKLDWAHAIGEAWWFNGALKRETRRGTRPMAGTIGNTGGNPRAVLLPAPLDFTTQDLELAVDYARSDLSVRSAYRLSVFDNGDRALSWQNPFAAIPGWAPAAGYPAYGRIGLPPDNRLHQASASAGWRASPSLRFNGEALVGRLRQSQSFLPYTVNPALEVTQALPRTALDGEIDTLRVELRALYDPVGPLSGGLGYRFDDRDNRTPRGLFVYVGGDSRNQDTSLDVSRARQNLPYSFRREAINAHAAWRWTPGTRLRGDAQRLETTRDFSEVETTRDDRLSLRLTGTLGDKRLLWHLQGAAERRRGDDYRGDAPWLATHTPDYVATVDENLRFANHPQLRKYYLADRDRRDASAGVQWLAGDTLTMGISGSYRKDDYDDSELGLTTARSRTLSADAGWTPRAGHHVDAWLTRDYYDSEQDGQSFRGNFLATDLLDPNRRWETNMRDRIDTAGFGWRLDELRPGLDAGFDYLWSQGRTDVTTRTGASLPSAPIPDTVSRIQRLDLYVRRNVSQRASVRVGWLHERGRISDWAYRDADVATLGNVLGLGEIQPDYRLNWITLRLNYRLH
jgi:MtrB/PioB family decaheme-associated outer membrane protein